MRTTRKWARASMAAVFFVATCVGDVHAADMKGQPGGKVGNDAVLRIPEGDGIEEALGIGISDEELPVLAGVGGFVDAGLIAGAGAHEVGGAGVDGVDAAEIQGFGSWDLGGAPGGAAVDGE